MDAASGRRAEECGFAVMAHHPAGRKHKGVDPDLRGGFMISERYLAWKRRGC